MASDADTITESAEPLELIEFSVGCSRTINLGNYESIKVEASVTMEIHEETNLEELKQRAQVELRSLLEETYRAQYKKRNGDPPY